MKHELLLSILGLTIEDPRTGAVLSHLSGEQEQSNPFEQRIYFDYVGEGISIAVDGPKKMIFGIFLFAEGHQGYGQFDGTLPFDLHFGVPMHFALKKIGDAPIKTTKIVPKPDDPMFKEHPWGKETLYMYKLSDYAECALSFGPQDTLTMVTLQIPFRAP